jgi:Anti-sigma-28 factor, FlgM
MQSRLSPADPWGKVIVMDTNTLRDQIRNGEYQVDPTAVADALLRRLQNECSYPASGPSASVNTTPAGPSATEPIQVTLLRALALRGGTQTHNS